MVEEQNAAEQDIEEQKAAEQNAEKQSVAEQNVEEQNVEEQTGMPGDSDTKHRKKVKRLFLVGGICFLLIAASAVFLVYEDGKVYK